MHEVSVFVLDLNRSEDTIECVGRVLAHNEGSVLVHILMNGSDANNREKITSRFKDHSAVFLYHSRVNLGFTGGVNYLFKSLRDSGRVSDYILLLNNDAFVYNDTIDILERAMESDAGIGIACPSVVSSDDDKTIIEDSIRFYPWLMQHQPVNSGKNLDAVPRRPGSCDMPVANGTCMLIRSDVFLKLNGLDDRFFAYFEDWDFCLRAREKGYRTVHVSASLVSHKGSATSGKHTLFYEYMLCRNRYQVARKHLPLPVFIFVFFPYFLVSRVVLKIIILGSGNNLSGVKGLCLALCWIASPVRFKEKFQPEVNL